MYSFVRSYVRVDHNWSRKNIASETLDYVLANYQAVRVTVTKTGVIGEIELWLKDLNDVLSTTDKSQTVENWIDSITLTGLPEHPATELSKAKNVKFTDLHMNGLKLTKGSHLYAPGITIPTGLDTDLKLDSSIPDYDEDSIVNLAANAVVTCNGRLLETIGAHGSLYALNGSVQATEEGKGIISLLDFTDIGGCEKVSLNESNVRVVPNKPSYDGELVKAVITTEHSLVDKTPLMVVNGKLKYKAGQVKVINKNQVLITVNKRSIVEDLLTRPHKEVDWVSPATVNKAGYKLESFDLKKLLLGHGSFLILLNTSELNVNEEHVSCTGLPGYYRHHRVPTGLLINEKGDIKPYLADDYNERVVSLNVGYDTFNVEYMTDTSKSDGLVVSRATEAKNRLPQLKAKIVDFYVV